MPLTSGTKLGPYEVLAPIGAGGMGDVYKATDTRLDRIVAIKVLPTELSHNEELRQRFEREARAVSSLNHPNICTLYDIGREGDVDFMVMEYLEGETLADLLMKGALSLEEALRYGREIADALDKAHREGVVHRDVKPGNIIITKPGAKLLDFGLATPLRRGFSEAGVDVSALTEAKPLTQEGTILGTFQYMAPEQLEGQDTDARTDIFAFGAVFYEMLTGRKAFAGKSQASLITAIMSADPPAPSSLRPVTPKRLDDAIGRCLAKDADTRWQSAGDLAWELGRATEDEPEARSRATSGRLPWMVAALAVLGAVVLLGLWLSRETPEPRLPIRTTILPPNGVRYNAGVALSPDGRTLVFSVVDSDGTHVLGVRPLDAVNTRVLDGTERGRYPFWSPDSTSIGFFADGRLKKISADGGPAQSLGDVPGGAWAVGTWSETGVILFAVGAGPIYRIPEAGGTPSAVTVLDREAGEIGNYSPHFLPDGNHFFYRNLYESGQTGDSAEVHVTSLDEPGASRVVLRVISHSLQNAAHYVEPGYVVFVDEEQTLYVQPFDPKSFELTGTRTPIARNVASPEGYVSLSVASNGTLIYGAAGSGDRDGLLRWRDRSGAVQGEVGSTWTFGLSRDARRVALNQGGMQLLTTGRAGPAQLGSEDIELEPVFSPDGRFVIYYRYGDKGTELIYRAVDAEEERSLSLPPIDTFFPSDWSPDGRTVALSIPNAELGGSYDVWLYSIEDETGEPFVSTEANERHGVFSPDGDALAYQSDETGEDNIYVRPLSGSGVSTRLSPDGGRYPEWRSDGEELFYLRLDGTLMAVAFEADSGFGEPTELFQIALRPNENYDLFDVAPNGERFLVLEQVGPQRSLTLIQNWPALLER